MLNNTDVMALLKALGQDGKRELCLEFAMFCANYPEVEGLNSDELRSTANSMLHQRRAAHHALLARASTNVEHVSLHAFYAYQAASLSGASGLEEKLTELLLGEHHE